jgi:predicted RecB family nuclease
MEIGRTASAVEGERRFERKWSVRVEEVQASACMRKRSCAKDVQAKRSVQGEAMLQFQCTL